MKWQLILTVYNYLDRAKVNARILRGPDFKSPTSIPILKPKVLGAPTGCAAKSSSFSSLSSCSSHCCLDVLTEQFTPEENNHHAIVADRPSLKEESDEKMSFKGKEIGKTESTLETSDSHNNNKLTTSPLSITSVIKVNAINNHVSEEVLPSLSPDKLDARINFSENDKNKKNHDNLVHTEQESSANSTSNLVIKNQVNNSVLSDTVDQHIDSKFNLPESYNDKGKFVSFTEKQEPKSLSTEYSKAEEFREKREAVDSRSIPLNHNNNPHSSSQSNLRIIRPDLIRSVQYIKLLELNATIGLEFCTTWQCVQEAGPSFTYLVPISKFMPYEFVTIQFR